MLVGSGTNARLSAPFPIGFHHLHDFPHEFHSPDSASTAVLILFIKGLGKRVRLGVRGEHQCMKVVAGLPIE
jgi:hypothetical protein